MRSALAALVLAAVAGAACGEGGAPPPRIAPTAPRASLVLEPPRMGIGEVAELELVVVTPPGHRVAPFAPPRELPGFWVLASEALDVERGPARWVHRTHLRLRAREVGRLVWPASSLEVEGPDGERIPLAIEALPIEVSSALEELPARQAPFGVRLPPGAGVGARELAAAAAGGALATLAALGIVGLARRRRARRTPASGGPESPPATPPWELARRALAAARAESPQHPEVAAHAAARALRRYVARRFATPAAARTTEELRAGGPPFSATSRWPAFVAILAELDALRFPPCAALPDDAPARVRALIEACERFVDDSLPPGSAP